MASCGAVRRGDFRTSEPAGRMAGLDFSPRRRTQSHRKNKVVMSTDGNAPKAARAAAARVVKRRVGVGVEVIDACRVVDMIGADGALRAEGEGTGARACSLP